MQNYCDFSVNKEDPEWPDIQLLFASAGDNTDGGIFNRRNTGIADDLYASVYEPILYKDAFTIAPLLLRPRSRGKISLRDASPYSHPFIFPNYLDDPHDLKTLVSPYLASYDFVDLFYLLVHPSGQQPMATNRKREKVLTKFKKKIQKSRHTMGP